LTSLSDVPANFPTNSLSVTYTDFKKIKTLTEGSKNYTLTYGVDDQRRKSVYKENSTIKETRYYIGDYEKKINNSTGLTQKIHYLPDAIYIENSNGTTNFYYAYTDILGSLTALVNENGTVAERYAYDPWGKRRNPNSWSSPDTRTSFLVNRGYTMHEHLDQFGIINMNGRVYDPLTASFFSPDPYVQAPDNWLNYNRYSYCLNNPFKYTDPDGEFFFTAILGPAGAIIDAACWGAVINGGLYTVSVALSSGGFDNWSWKDFGYSCLNGAINGALSSVNPLSWNVGGFSIGIQPNLMVSSNGMGFGATVGLDYNITKWMSAGIDIGFQHYFMTTGTEQYNESAFMFGYGLEFGNKKDNISLYSTHFAATDGSSQRTGGIGMNLGEFNMRYENDGAPPFWGLLGSNKDQYRTAAAQIGWGDWNLRLNMMTGPGSDKAEIKGQSSMYPYGYYEGSGVNDVRFGALSIGYGNFRIGVNSEGIRHFFQNQLIHNSIGQAGFKVLDNNWYPYYYWGTTNRYSLW
jgi:RHS repeat-associated protein